jgi:DtxR family transcriptional regulator, Mn-dependent transcriptional regulator
MRTQLSQAVEDYLKAIYHLTEGGRRASTNEIADRMGVAAASVTGMIQKLAATDPTLVDYQKHQGVRLTEAGEKAALELIRHHRLLELYLHEKLGYAWDEVHAEADRLEHFISEQFEERLARELGDPSQDPHGEPIPDREFHMPEGSGRPLRQLRTGDQAVVQSISGADPDLLRYLAAIGMLPGVRLSILDFSPFDDNLRLSIDGQAEPVVLGPRITGQIFVSDVEDS